jgi:hypothetical protein
LDGPKQKCPECGYETSNVKSRKANYKDVKRPNSKTPTSGHVSTTYAYACGCGKVFTRTIPVK